MTRRAEFAVAALVLSAGAALALGQPVAGTFVAEEFFAAQVAGSGTITTLFFWKTDFTNRFDGRVADGEILIEESFRFPDATPKQVWRLTRREGGRYDGDVTTQGADGRMRGPVPVAGWTDPDGLHLDYAGYAPDSGDTRFRFRHALVPQADGTVVNTVSVSWWGIPVARSRAVFTKAASGG